MSSSDIKGYKTYQTENLYVVGAGTCNEISSMTKEKYTANGIDRFDTLYKALDFINK